MARKTVKETFFRKEDIIMIKILSILIMVLIIFGAWALCFLSGHKDIHKTEEQLQYISDWKRRRNV